MRPLPPPFPPNEVVLTLPPAELAEFLVRYLDKDLLAEGRFHQPNGLGQFRECAGRTVAQAVAEAWAWAEASGWLVYSVDSGNVAVVTLSRACKHLIQREGFARHRQAAALPRDMLHPIIAEQAWPLFIAGRYDTAVFAAFKALEIAVSDASGCPGTGTALMRSAFHKTTGPLSDKSTEEGEREAIGHLFAGAFGSFRNPVGHREVSYASPTEPAEQLVIASHLMRIVETSKAR